MEGRQTLFGSALIIIQVELKEFGLSKAHYLEKGQGKKETEPFDGCNGQLPQGCQHGIDLCGGKDVLLLDHWHQKANLIKQLGKGNLLGMAARQIWALRHLDVLCIDIVLGP